MEVINLLHFGNRSELRQWLKEDHNIEKCCWVVTYRSKRPPEWPAIPYIEVVEEALCFGWIDSTIKHIDSTHRAQRFTPRKKGSPYSRPNIERLIWLDEQGMLHPRIRDSVLPLIRAPYIFPDDILDAIKADGVAWKNYEKLSEPYKRIRIAYIDAARKRPDEFKKRMESFIKKTRDGKLIIGFGGIDKYYG